MSYPWARRLTGAVVSLVAAATLAAQTGAGTPKSETLFYTVEWRLIHAGNVKLTWGPAAEDGDGFQANLFLQSAGLVSKLYRVENNYLSNFNDSLCIRDSLLKTSEGSRRRETRVTFDAARKKAHYVERDLVKNTTVSQDADIQACEHDVIGALYLLRGMNLEPGKSASIPVSDGKKAVMARVDAQEREIVKINDKQFKTIRYEAFLFNNVLYRRSGRLFVWLTDDDRKIPVQIRVRLPFYIGTVTLTLENPGKV
jgi:hypothetical protein